MSGDKVVCLLPYSDSIIISSWFKQGDKQLLQQFQALRQTCIPEICFLLHSVLHSVADYQQVFMSVLGER